MTSATATATKPKRIQRKRTKGWSMPPNTVYVGRPTRYGNPYRVQMQMVDLLPAVLDRFRLYAEHRIYQEPDWLTPLRGKDLSCWCREGAPCHADILLELANQ